MNAIHQKLTNIDLQRSRNAAEYQELYQGLKSLAKEHDNKRPADSNPRAGEVSLKTTEDQVHMSLSYVADQGYTGERLGILRSETQSDGAPQKKVNIRANPTDPKGRYLRFERWEYEGADISAQSHKETVLVDTQKGTLFREV